MLTNWRTALSGLLVFLTISILQGQSIDSTLTVTVDVNTTLSDLMDVVAEQTGFSFSYNPKKIKTDVPIDISVSDLPLLPFLAQLTTNTDYTFMLVERQIVIKLKRSGGGETKE